MRRIPRISFSAALCLAAVLALPLGGCASIDSFSLGGLFGAKEDDFLLAEQPADKLYNEGLTLLNRREYDDAAKKFIEVDRQHPYSEWARKSLLMTAYAYYRGRQVRRNDPGGAPLRDAASGQRRRGLCAIPDRPRPFSTRSPTSPATRAGPSAR